jgi:hypothetical protein
LLIIKYVVWGGLTHPPPPGSDRVNRNVETVLKRSKNFMISDNREYTSYLNISIVC